MSIVNMQGPKATKEICQLPRRSFKKINTGVANEFGQGNIGDEEFLPDQEEKQIDL